MMGEEEIDDEELDAEAMFEESKAQLQEFIKEIGPDFFGGCPCTLDLDILTTQYGAAGMLHENIMEVMVANNVCHRQMVPLVALAVSMSFCRAGRRDTHQYAGKMSTLDIMTMNHHMFWEEFRTKMEALDARLQKRTESSCRKN